MNTVKPIKYSVAIILRNGHRPGDYLAVKRPFDDSDFADSWGLPAITLKLNESPEDGARRICREKLNCNAEPIRFLGAMYQERNAYSLVLMDIEMILVGAAQPDVTKSHTTATTYRSQKWTNNPDDLLQSAQNGSCCSSIFLQDQGVLERTDWLSSLSGSHKVG